MRLLLILTLIIISTSSFSQEFTEVDANFTGLSNGHGAWGDIDNDDDLDLLVCGHSPTYYKTILYVNNSDNTFTDTGLTFEDVIQSSSEWGDYNNDGFIDLLHTGSTPMGSISMVYKNNGDNTFTEVDNLVLSAVGPGVSSWLDVNNDGALDIFLMSNNAIKIYTNKGNNIFVEIAQLPFKIYKYGDADWGDYNNDGFPDLITTGEYEDSIITDIYQNLGNNEFQIIENININGVLDGQIDWVDTDGDGDLDIFITGKEKTTYPYDLNSSLYINNGDNTFTLYSNNTVDAFANCNTAWGDLDNDGDIDLAITGKNDINDSYEKTIIFNNIGNNNFEEQPNSIFPDLINGNLTLGDYDNDNDIDILLTGENEAGTKISKIYRNDIVNVNTPPLKITGSFDTVAGNVAKLFWNKTSDDHCASTNLMYNIFIGKKQTNDSIKNAMSNLSNGFRKLALKTYIIDTSYTIFNLDTGKYYWGVQAIDNAYCGSLFSQVDSFEITFINKAYPTETQINLPATNGDTIFVSETKTVDSRQWKIGYYSNGPYSEIPGETDTCFVPNFNDFGDYYIVCESTKGNVTVRSNEVKIKVPVFSENRDIVIPNIIWGGSDWGDFDNDGDLDLVITGDNLTKIYQNNTTSFDDINAGLPDLHHSTVQWGDYNNDSYLDLLLIGMDASWGGTAFSKIYLNNGDNSFSEDKQASIEGVSHGSCSWEDFNNDGFIDIIISGLTNNEEAILHIYKNNGTNEGFQLVTSDLKSCYEGDFDCGDVNNDNLIDIIVTGVDINGNKHTTLYKNNGDFVFTVEESFDRASYSTVEFGDYNADGQLDFYFGASSGHNIFPKIYKNNNNELTDINADIHKHRGYEQGDAKWIDYDNDGDLDLFISGYFQNLNTNAVSYLYENTGNDQFALNQTTIIPPVYNSDVSIADYDNDGDLDIFLNGESNTDEFNFRLYQNNATTGNTSPSIPTGLIDSVSGSKAFLKWNAAIDNQTASSAISYNIKIGSTPGANDIFSSNSKVNGYHKIADEGNVGIDTIFFINLPAGQYFWSVQAIDNGLQTSAFSSESQFEVLPPFIKHTIGNILNSNDSYISLGDYDNDNDLDIILSGQTIDSIGYELATRLFENTGNNIFVENNQTNFQPYFSNTIEWFDFNLDNNLDLLISGRHDFFSMHNSLSIYKNNGDGTFSQIIMIDIDSYFAFSTVGDFNNDGLPDILVSAKEVFILKNIGNDSFTQDNSFFSTSDLKAKSLCSDFNNDGYLDILENKANIEIFYQENDLFVSGDIIHSERAINGDIDISDYNNDGYADVLLMGKNSLNDKSTHLFKNNGDNTFTEIDNTFRSAISGSLKWGDINLDGYMDFIIAGVSADPINKIYFNHRNNIFSEYTSLPPSYHISVDYGDINNDGGLDIAISGQAESGVWVNNYFKGNTKPNKPQNLSYTNQGYGIKLKWNRAADNESQDGGLSYNVMVRKDSAWGDVVNPLADTSGYRKIPKTGNAHYNNFFILDSLPVGTYYWKVQAIDQSFMGGDWSEESSFEITRLRPYFSADTVCFGDSTTLTNQSIYTGTKIEQYEWTFSDTTYVSNDSCPKRIFNSAGRHYVTLTIIDTAGVSASKTDSIFVLPRPEAIISTTDVCFGTPTPLFNNSETDTLAIQQWEWNFDDSETTYYDQNPGTHQYLDTGIFEIQLKIIAENGCNDSAQVTTTVAAYPVAGISASGNPEFCEGDSIKLTVPNNANYAYNWKIGTASVQNSDLNTFYATESGKHTVSVTNERISIGCTTHSTDTVEVIVNNLPGVLPINIDGATTFCDGNEVELSVNGNQNYKYNWKKTDGNQNYIAFDTTAITVSDSNAYTYQVIDRNTECAAFSTDTVQITVLPAPALPEVILNGDNEFCENETATLSIEDDGLIYKWYGDDGLVEENTNNIIIDTSGNYVLVVSNNYDCSVTTDPTPITVNPLPPAFSIDYSGETTFCSGDSLVLSVPENSDITYNWIKKGATPEQDEYVAFDKRRFVAHNTGSFFVEATNENGCMKISNDTINVIVHPTPSKPNIQNSGTDAFCAGESITLSVPQITENTYQWYNGSSPLTDETTNELLVESSGDYLLHISNDNCSVTTDPTPITVNPLPPAFSIDYSGETTFCSGDSLVLTVPENSDVTYNWIKKGATPGQDEYVALNKEMHIVRTTGNYFAEAVTSFGCKKLSTDTVHAVKLNAPTVPSVSINGSTQFCAGETITLSVTYQDGMNYQWQKDGNDITGETNTSLIVSEEGSYRLKVSNENGCSVFTQAITTGLLDAPPAPVIEANNDLEFCEGDSVILSFDEIEGCSSYWIYGADTVDMNSYSFMATQEGTYTVRLENENGCTSDAEVDINVIPAPSPVNISLDGNPSFCEGESVTLSVTAESGFNYQWYNQNGAISGATGTSYEATETGTYHVYISNDTECDYTTPAVQVQSSEYPPQQNITADGDTLVCPGNEVQFHVTEHDGFTYEWKHDGVSIPNASSHQYTALEEGKYTVDIDNSGCGISTSPREVLHKPAPPKPDLIAEGPNVWILACSNDSALNYKWYHNGELIPGETEHIYLANQNLGDYYVTINNGGECSISSDIVTIPLGTGIDDVAKFGEIKIYPNPTPGVFNIEMNNQLIGKIYIRITNLNGKELFNLNFQKHTRQFQTQMDLSGQGKGIYLIEFRFEKDVTVRKLVVE